MKIKITLDKNQPVFHAKKRATLARAAIDCGVSIRFDAVDDEFTMRGVSVEQSEQLIQGLMRLHRVDVTAVSLRNNQMITNDELIDILANDGLMQSYPTPMDTVAAVGELMLIGSEGLFARFAATNEEAPSFWAVVAEPTPHIRVFSESAGVLRVIGEGLDATVSPLDDSDFVLTVKDNEALALRGSVELRADWESLMSEDEDDA